VFAFIVQFRIFRIFSGSENVEIKINGNIILRVVLYWNQICFSSQGNNIVRDCLRETG
jgi:hypothetical protein